MTGKIWALKHDGMRVTWHKEIADTNLQIICFALDDDGEVLVVGYNGTIHRLMPNTADVASERFPRLLSQTGLFKSTVEQVPAEGVVEYAINAHQWADRTTSRQWLALPGDTQLTTYDRSDWMTGQLAGAFQFPHDAVLVKTISYRDDPSDLGSFRHLETQLLHRNGDDWNAYNYVWNESQSDATLQDNVAADREIQLFDPRFPDQLQPQTWHHASRDECLLCHIWSASTVHGFKLEQLNRTALDGSSNQLDQLSELGLFAAEVPRPTPVISPDDTKANLEQRARSYLHMNCAHCHRRGGGGTAPFELVGDLPLEDLHVIDAPPSQGDFGLAQASVISSGDPFHSVLMYRLVKSGRGHMPQFGPSLIDDSGVLLIRDWIASLKPHARTDQQDYRIDQVLRHDDVPSAELTSLVDSLLDNTGDALALSVACCEPSVSPAMRLAIADIASKRSDSSIRDLFERFLPPERRVKRLGNSIDPAMLLSLSGNVDAGRELFEKSLDVSCRQCHQIGDVGIAVGPNLSGIGATQKPAEILESLLSPSAKIDERYRGKLVLTADGRTLAGLVVSEDTDSISLVEASGKPIVIHRDDIETIKPMNVSVMPERILAEFTAQQAADMMAFLSAQKQPVESTTTSTGPLPAQ
jgi:putative heme-binding domain-containing protein